MGGAQLSPTQESGAVKPRTMRLVVAAALAVAVHAMDTSDDPGEDITVVPNVSATRGFSQPLRSLI